MGLSGAVQRCVLLYGHCTTLAHPKAKGREERRQTHPPSHKRSSPLHKSHPKSKANPPNDTFPRAHPKASTIPSVPLDLNLPGTRVPWALTMRFQAGWYFTGSDCFMVSLLISVGVVCGKDANIEDTAFHARDDVETVNLHMVSSTWSWSFARLDGSCRSNGRCGCEYEGYCKWRWRLHCGFWGCSRVRRGRLNRVSVIVKSEVGGL